MTQMVVNAHALESGSLAMTPSGHRVANLCLNLAVIHAYSVLEQTLANSLRRINSRAQPRG